MYVGRERAKVMYIGAISRGNGPSSEVILPGPDAYPRIGMTQMHPAWGKILVSM